jgi:hypothetical protein
MKRWNVEKSEYIENLKIDEFLKEISKVCKKHGFSISHEDGHGAFEIETFDKYNIEWLMDAHDGT